MSPLALAALAAALTTSPEAPAGLPTADAGTEAAPIELHGAPEPRTPNAPPEATLSPPPDAEKQEAQLGFVQIENPAFPSHAPPPPPVNRGRRFDAADVAPYFAGGTAEQAREELDKGHFAKARQLLDNEGSSKPVRYLRALASFRALDYARAADEFASLATDYEAMKDHCLTHAGIASEELQHWQAAAGFYGQVSKGSRLYPDARLGMFRSLRHLGDLNGARDAVAPLADWPGPGWGRDVGAEALIGMADLARARRDFAGEREALVRLWSTHPMAHLAGQAERRLDMPRVPMSAQVAHAEGLVEANRNALGLAALQPLVAQLKLPDPLACRANFAYGKALRKERQHGRAIQALVPVVEKCKDPDLLPRALYVLGFSRSIVDPPRSVQTYDRLARDFPAHPFAAGALFYAADQAAHVGDTEGALARLDDLAKRYPNSDFSGEALFRKFWIHRARGESSAAIAALDRMEATFKDAYDPYEMERAEYWRARTKSASDPGTAGAEYEALGAQHPTTYYGYLARLRLEELDRARGEKLGATVLAPLEGDDIWPVFAGPLSDDPNLSTGVELLRLGFKDAVPDELLAVSRANLPPESIRLLVYLLAAAGDGQSAHGVARVSLRRELSGPISRPDRRLWEIAYPQAFRDMVDKHCQAAHVDPDLLQALMREESALDPKALSWAGALGLTQLMLPTARSVARTLKIPYVSEALLLQPDLNIRIGSWFLGDLMRQFKGQKEFALAGYNAGPHSVGKWRAERPKVAMDEWVEEIPYSETRGYVKRVLRTYVTYQLLYASPPATASASAK
jgi:soluble lytic murein transglycosylase